MERPLDFSSIQTKCDLILIKLSMKSADSEEVITLLDEINKTIQLIAKKALTHTDIQYIQNEVDHLKESSVAILKKFQSESVSEKIEHSNTKETKNQLLIEQIKNSIDVNHKAVHVVLKKLLLNTNSVVESNSDLNFPKDEESSATNDINAIFMQSNKMKSIFQQELAFFAEEPNILKGAIINWKEKITNGEICNWRAADNSFITQKCEYTTRAILLLTQTIFNAFIQIHGNENLYVKNIKVEDREQWEKAYTIDLKTMSKKIEEPGTRLYALNIWGNGLKSPDGNWISFPGHTLTILQTVSKEGKPVFDVIQSYVEEYTFKEFLNHNESSKSTSVEGMKNITQDWKTIVDSDYWTQDTINAWKDITHVDTTAWKDMEPIGFGTSIKCIELPQLSNLTKEKENETLKAVENALKELKNTKPSPIEPMKFTLLDNEPL